MVSCFGFGRGWPPKRTLHVLAKNRLGIRQRQLQSASKTNRHKYYELMCLVNIVYRIHNGLPLSAEYEPLHYCLTSSAGLGGSGASSSVMLVAGLSALSTS